jgi:hypothetical protein
MKRWRPPDRHLLVQSTVPLRSTLLSAGQKAERIRLRLEGSHECGDLRLGDGVGVDDFEVNTCGEQDTDDSGVGGSSLL